MGLIVAMSLGVAARRVALRCVLLYFCCFVLRFAALSFVVLSCAVSRRAGLVAQGGLGYLGKQGEI